MSSLDPTAMDAAPSLNAKKETALVDPSGAPVVAPQSEKGHEESAASSEHNYTPVIYTSEEARKKAERALVWKIDRILMPLLTISFGLQYFDKAVLNSASIFGIIADLGLSTTTNGVTSTLRYSTANSAFYWGYIIAVLPFSLLLRKFPLAKTLSLCILAWGVTVLLTIVVTNYEGLVVQRVFLGALESSVSPGFVMITSQWYKQSEQATRLGIWYSATGIFSVFSGLVNYGLAQAGGSLAPWKAMYIFAGAWTIVWALVVLLVVPDSPQTSHRWFNEEERRMLAERTRESMMGATGATSCKWSHAREAARDVKIYLFFLMGAAIYICNGGVTAFGARIVASFGYTSLQTILLLIPGGVFTMVSIYLFAWLSGHYKNITTLLIPISCIPVVVGSLIIWQASWAQRGVPLFGYYLLPCFGAPYVLVLASSAANIAGSTKKALSAGAIFLGYNVGNIVAPYLVLTPERAIKYRTTWISIIICMALTALFSLALRFYLQRENARRDALRNAGSEAGSTDKVDVHERQEQLDLTDGQNLEFRYSL